ncbi:MAG: hypothetical protein KAT65_03970, partial [Methanophagales archaeon]|nr:hypothetical protein [Methanophagales archaeon]
PLKELLGEAPYGKTKELTKPPGKLDVEAFRCEEEGSRHWRNIQDLTSTFKRTGNLKPEEMLRLLESEKYAIEKKKEDLWWEIESEKINKVENKYYQDIPNWSAKIEKGIQKEMAKNRKISIKEAKERITRFSDELNELENKKLLDSKSKELIMKQFLKRLTTSLIYH